MKLFKNTIKIIGAAITAMVLSISALQGYVSAATTFAMSPMKQKIVLTPGQDFRGSFKVTNPATNDTSFDYEAKVEAIKFDDDYKMSLGETEQYSQIAKWIALDNPKGTVEPNTTIAINFTIAVPENAPAGGQYAAITVGTVAGDGNGSVNIKQNVQLAHVIYANVAGETTYSTNVSEIELPSFLFSGNISASALVENKGNGYVDVEHVLQVYPLFSSEEVYTNEEDPDVTLVLPETSRRTTTEWSKTPSMGVFNVHYAVIINGEVAGSTDKMVIICPIWLLFVVIFAAAAIIIYLFVRAKGRGKNSRKSE